MLGKLPGTRGLGEPPDWKLTSPGAIAMDRKIRAGDTEPKNVDPDAEDVARVAIKYWGDQAVDLLTRAAEVAKEWAERGGKRTEGRHR